MKPLPEGWREGDEIDVEGHPVLTDADDIIACLREVDKRAKEHADPDDWKRIDAVLAENKRIAKEQMRKEMGLDS